LFEFPTIAGLAAALDEAQTNAPRPVPALITRSADGVAADLLANLDRLTDEQVELLLKESMGDNIGN
jgi:hypothetical protein